MRPSPFRLPPLFLGLPFALSSLALLAWPAGAFAQSARWEVDLNGSRVQFDTLDAVNAPSLGTALEWRGRTLLARVGGSFTSFEGDGESVQGRGDLVGWFRPAGESSPLRLEVSGGAGGSSNSSGFDSWVAQGDLRLHLQRTRYGGWIGVGAAQAKNTLDPEPLGTVLPSVGAWVQVGDARLVARYLDTRVEGERFPEANLSAVYSRGAVDITAFAGYRASPFDGVDDDSWVGASLAWWVESRLALLISAGQYAPDVIQGLPGGEFVSLGVRFSPQRRRPVVRDVPLPLLFTEDDARSGGVGFRVPGAAWVEVAGDWNAWQLEPMTQAPDGRWLLPGGLAPGVYRFNLRVDGERWMVPEGIPTADDGFGGQVGILVISASGV